MAGFEHQVVYQIYPKSFYDANGDGLGDLEGIRQKLDYLQWLGVDYLWLTPFFPSPQRDNGYDVAEYCAVDPAFGAMEDLEALIRDADARGIGLMLDMVFNHTSTEHIWFQKALAGDPQYMDYYIFRDGEADRPPTNWASKFGGSAWAYVPSLKKWYLHLFDVTQADLNWENPAVREELKRVVRFWKGKGVKGFRFDVVNLISKPADFADDDRGDGRRFYTDGRHVHEFLQELVRDTGIGGMITVGEMSSTSLDNCIRYSAPEQRELSMVFSFHHLKIDYAGGDKWALMEPDLGRLRQLLADWQEGMEAGNGWNALFWCNHDQPRVVSRLGAESELWEPSAKALALAIHGLRGTPYVYQGEELGMTNAHFSRIEDYRDVESQNYYRILREQGKSDAEAMEVVMARSRDNGRTPMQWNREKNAGFTAGTPWIAVPAWKPEANVAEERSRENSILGFYRRLIRLRKQSELIARGSVRFLCPERQGLLAYERRLEGERLAAVVNLTGQRQRVPLEELGLRDASGWLLDSWERAPETDGAELLLEPFEGVLIRA